MTVNDHDQYTKARESAHNYFLKNKKIRSPVFKTVSLTSDGFMHLIYHDRFLKKKRTKEAQIQRFHLLQHTRSIIESMGYYQEYLEQYQTVMVRMKKHRSEQNKLVRYWGFVAVINNRIRVKLVLRQIGDGHIHFWSIIPYWKTRSYKEIRYADLSTGDLEND